MRNSTVSIKGPNGRWKFILLYRLISIVRRDRDENRIIVLNFRRRGVSGDREMWLRWNMPQNGPHGDCSRFQRSRNKGRYEYNRCEAGRSGKFPYRTIFQSDPIYDLLSLILVFVQNSKLTWANALGRVQETRRKCVF